jgi:hypothetical protein
VTDLTTVAAVKTYIGKTDVADDAALQALVTAYSQFVRSWTNRDFTVQSYDLWRSGRGQVLMLTPQWPITGVTSVTVDGRSIAAQSAWGAYGFRFTDRAVVLDGGACFAPGASNVHIVYSAGYAAIPADVAQAVNELVALRFKLSDKLEWSSKSLAGQTVSLITRDMPASVTTALKQYQNVVPL